MVPARRPSRREPVSTPDEPGQPGRAVELLARAKLTTSLRVVGVRADGFHLLDAEMVSLDLADTLEVTDADDVRITVEHAEGVPLNAAAVPDGPENLVARALSVVGRPAHVHLRKRIPAGAGLGGGSADAAAILRWAGCIDAAMAAGIGADVPFCLVGGRAAVSGIGEVLSPLPHEDRAFVLLLAPFGVETAAVYRAWDALADDPPAPSATGATPANDLERAALRVEPRLVPWRHAFEQATGRRARLAGSGSTWFVEGSLESLRIGDPTVRVGGATGRLVTTRTVPPEG
jgi:4-diphosphocytidyl-2-C-methyl-D-erythritol kinase